MLNLLCKSIYSMKNLSQTQQTLYQSLIIGANHQHYQLIAYLVQKLKPTILPYKQLLLHQITDGQILTNQDLEHATKLLQKIQNADLYIQEYQATIQNKRIQSTIIQLNYQNPLLSQEQLLLQLKIKYPDCTLEQIQKLNQKQNNTQQIYQKIETFTPRDIPDQHNTPEMLSKHKQITEGKIVLRFPPEPNGYLHLGHVRSIRLNFHSAEQLQGTCYLRFDDTNPANEKQLFIDQIQDNVKWFGYLPKHITYASDYFDFLYECAIKLIKDKKAYICEQNRIDMKEYRKLKQSSPYRERSVNENLRIFQEMQQGLHPENKYTLRLKIDSSHSNPTLRDPVIYRVLYTPHPRSGTKWKVYPLYDFAHCICDSLENITHSLCTLEFEIRRELYYWILSNLNLYKPFVYEFSRLNVSNNMLSKRKIAKLIEMGYVSGWDDPRLLTLAGLKRRGYTPQSLNDFIDQCSVPRGGNEQIISIKLLEHCIRKELEKSAPKIMAILNPILITIHDQNKSHQVYIQATDIKLNDQPDFYGLAPNKSVCLRFYGIVHCESIIVSDAKIMQLDVRLISTDIQERKKMKGQLNWLNKNECINATVNEYSYLFDLENPSEDPEFWKSINKDSLRIYDVKVPIKEYKVGERFQFERNGFYIVDSIIDGHITFNKIVGLVEGEKKSLK